MLDGTLGPKVFSDVTERAGYIAQADGKALFLDEVDALPWTVQKSLLRVLEDGRLARIGETKEREVDVKFVLATNRSWPDLGIAEDLLARLRVVRVPSLAERRADIPWIFEHLLYREIERAGKDLDPSYIVMTAQHYETLMLDGFEQDNVRGLHDLAERIATRMIRDLSSKYAVPEVLEERYGRKFEAPINTRLERDDVDERHRAATGRTTLEVPMPASDDVDLHALVREAYDRVGSNVTAIQEHLRARGHEISWRRIARILDELGLPRQKRGG